MHSTTWCRAHIYICMWEKKYQSKKQKKYPSRKVWCILPHGVVCIYIYIYIYVRKKYKYIRVSEYSRIHFLLTGRCVGRILTPLYTHILYSDTLIHTYSLVFWHPYIHMFFFNRFVGCILTPLYTHTLHTFLSADTRRIRIARAYSWGALRLWKCMRPAQRCSV